MKRIQKCRIAGIAAVAAAVAATPLAWSGTSSATGSGGTAVTISLSGSTAMSNFTRGAGFSLLNPGSTVDLLSGPAGAPVRYKADTTGTTSVQLGAINFTSGITVNPATGTPAGDGDPPAASAHYGALRIEWHEQGSVEGILELADSQLNDSIFINTIYNGTSATGIFINQNKFGGTTPTTAWSPPATANLAGFDIATFANANDRTTLQTQNRVQMAISDVNAAQGFSRSGANGVYNLAPGVVGYGKGNPALTPAGNISGIGIAGGQQRMQDEIQLNMTTSTVDPATDPGDVGAGGGSGTHYAAGPWNNAGTGNLHNTPVAVTATTFSANPGTGLARINKSDARWLQATGRLANGADFNVATRDVNSGTRNVAALNVGLDPSWAVGENDAGAGGGTAFDGLGATINFSNKSSGGSNLRPTVQNARMAIGHLSLSDYRNTAGGADNGARPLRALDVYSTDTDSGSAGAATITVGGKTYVLTRDGAAALNAYNMTNGNYVAFQNQTYVTVKSVTQGATALAQFVTDYTTAEGVAPTSQQQADFWAGTKINGGASRTYVLNDNPTVKVVTGNDTVYGTSIKGDNHSPSGTDYGNDVYDVRQNILNSVNQFPPTSTASPADNLLLQAFILPQFMVKQKDRDGGALFNNPTYNATLSNIFLGSSVANNFDTNGTTGLGSGTLRGPKDITLGSSSTYGNVTPGGGQGAIPITDTAPGKGNWMFGNFRQNGVRDFAAVMAAADAQSALQASGLGTDMFAGAAASNNAAVPGVATALQNFNGTSNASKGDLIVMGDYNSDGQFDGKDLYQLARGAALSDAAGAGFAAGELTSASGGIANDFADWVRRGVLRKNAALDFMDGKFAAGTVQAIAASANATNDPTGARAFNKRDVNRDGLIDFVDGVTSDKFFGMNYTNLDDQLAATTNVRDWELPRPLSLVDVELNDTGNIDQTDLNVINTVLTGAGSETWATGTLIKSGAGTVSVAYSTGGTIKVNTGATLLISNGTVDVGGTQDIFTDNTASPTNGNHVAVVNNATSSLIISAGGKAIATLSGVGNTSVSAGASLTTDYARQNALTVNGTLAIRSAAPNTRSSIVNTLAIGAAGTLDLSNQNVIAHATPVGTWNGSAYTDLTGQIASGRNGSTTPLWDGNGIVTSQSDATGSNLTSIGISTGTEVLLSRGLAATETYVWNGQTISAADSLVMYTYGGDANLDGKLNIDDYVAIDQGIANGFTGWSNGDFNYDGKVNIDDYTTVIDSNIGNQSLGTLASASGGDLTSGVTAVPEPGTVGLTSVVAALSLRRGSRRRRR